MECVPAPIRTRPGGSVTSAMPESARRLFPDLVHWKRSSLELMDISVDPAEAAHVERAGDKRRREFLGGRSMARQVLRDAGFPTNPILIGPQREPLWPSGIVGSLTHSEGHCAAAVALEEHIPALGIDLERRSGLDRKLWARILTRKERETLARLPDDQQEAAALAHFSAKEALYKCLFPRARVWFDFQDAELALDREAQSLHVMGLAGDVACALRGRQIVGRYLQSEADVLTAFWLV